MADVNSSLPVKTLSPGDVQSIIVDATTPSQGLKIDSSGRIIVKLDDAAGNGITSQVNGTQQALDVGINVAGVQIDPRQIRALTAADIVTAQQGTSPWVTKDQSDGPVTPGTVASFSSLIGGQYNTALPTLTNGQQSAIQIDSSGRLLITATLSEDQNYGTVGATTLRTAAQIGNATGAADFNAGTTGAQTLRVQANQGASATAANGWFVKPTDGTNNQAYLATGEAKVSVTQPLPAGANTIGSVNQGTSPWITKDQADGSATGGTAGSFSMLSGGIFNTAAPTLTNGQQASLQLDSSGNLDVNLKTAIPSGTNTIGNVNVFSGGAANSPTNPIYVSSDSTPGTSVNDAKAASAITAGSSDNHDYTVTAGKTMYFDQAEAASAGAAKMEVFVETGVATGVFTSRFVKFNSTAFPSMRVSINNPITVAAGVRVRITMTNREVLSAENLYSTISGTES